MNASRVREIVEESHAGVIRGNSDPAEHYFLALVIIVVAVGLAVTGVHLLVTCVTAQFVDQFGRGSIGCSYPFYPDGLVFLYAAGLLSTLVVFPVRRALLARGREPGWSPIFVSVAVAAGETFLFLVIYFLVQP